MTIWARSYGLDFKKPIILKNEFVESRRRAWIVKAIGAQKPEVAAVGISVIGRPKRRFYRA